MSGFSPEWLRLREAADRRARNRDIESVVQARFAQRDAVTVVDLGCGTGSNVRAIASLLPNVQSWTLVDNDAALLDEARKELTAWADHAEAKGGELHLTKSHATLSVTFKCLNIASDLEGALPAGTALVTASALFDLTSEDFIRAFARRCADIKAAMYAVLTYNGIQRWEPHRPADNQMSGAFHRHQLRDKGFGASAGPMAASLLADQFKLGGFLVQEGDSTWRLSRNDRTLLEELVRGHAMAVSETGLVDAKTIEAWVKVTRSAALVGHTDTFAVPVQSTSLF